MRPRKVEIDGNTWVISQAIGKKDNGATFPLLRFENKTRARTYVLEPNMPTNESGGELRSGSIHEVEDNEMIPGSIDPATLDKELRGELADAISEILFPYNVTPSDRFVEALTGDESEPSELTSIMHLKGERLEQYNRRRENEADAEHFVDDVVEGAHAMLRGEGRGQTPEAKAASEADDLRAQGLPADYAEQIDRALDEGGPEAARALAEKFKPPEGGHRGREEAREDNERER